MWAEWHQVPPYIQPGPGCAYVAGWRVCRVPDSEAGVAAVVPAVLRKARRWRQRPAQKRCPVRLGFSASWLGIEAGDHA